MNTFTVDALQDAVDELPQAGMVIVIRRVVDPEVYDRARELEVCVDTFGGFDRALRGFGEALLTFPWVPVHDRYRRTPCGVLSKVSGLPQSETIKTGTVCAIRGYGGGYSGSSTR